MKRHRLLSSSSKRVKKKLVKKIAKGTGKIISADFIFNDPSEEDLVAIQNLILNTSRYLPWKSNIDETHPSLTCLSNLISEQANVGTLLKTDSEEFSSTIGLVSILNFRQYKQMDVIKSALLEEIVKIGATKEIEELFNNNQVGLVINERLINVPMELICKLFENLLLDIEWSLTSGEVPKEEVKYYEYTHLIFISRILNLKKNNNHKLGFQPFFYKFEEAEFFNQSQLHYAWPSGEMNLHMKKLYPEHNLIFLISFDKFKSVVKRLTDGDIKDS